jgi:DeoR/GlpR family transcriptional regulator of sugar metabolism
MNAIERRKKIYDLIKNIGETKNSMLSKKFDVSEITIRRDLDKLEEAGLIKRAYGTSKIIDGVNSPLLFKSRENENRSAKQKIAQKALSLLENVNSIYIDESTTCYELVKILPEKPLIVFTNNISSVLILRQTPRIKTFVIGGFLADDTNTTDGEVAINTAKNIFVDLAFISCHGFSAKGFVNDGLIGSQVKKIIIENSMKTCLLADNSKFNRRGLFMLGTWNEIDAFITDEVLPETDIEIIKKFGVEII